MKNGAVTATIYSEGQKISSAFQPVHIEVTKEVNRIPTAQITLADGDIAKRRFDASDSDAFAPGKEIKIRIRYEGDPDSASSLFTGIVTNQTVEAGNGHFHLIVECRDKAFKMSTLRKSAIFRKEKDSAIIDKILEKNELKKGNIEDTKTVHPEMVQYACTDWDFMLLRAEANGLLVNVDDGEVAVVKPKIADVAKHTFEFGMGSILALEMRADASRQFGKVEANAWASEQQDMLGAEAADAFALKQSKLKPSKLATAVGADTLHLAAPGWRSRNEMKAWADSRLLRSRLSLFRGWLAVEGQGNIKVLDTIEIKGISDKFNGLTLITGVRQQYGPGGWRTEIQFGLPEEPFAQANPDVHALPAAGLLPAIRGLHTGVVDHFETDPEGQYRVKVRIPTLQASDNVVWARQLRPDAGPERGIFFYPEPGDEVVLGFLGEDPRDAILLGSLHSSKQELPKTASKLDENNALKGIFTLEGLELRFDDKQKTITVATSDQQQIVINGEKSSIEITDANSNTITLDKSSIEIKDANNNTITLDKTGISLKSDANISIEASGNVVIKGAMVNIN